jgi:hypothetical protein
MNDFYQKLTSKTNELEDKLFQLEKSIGVEDLSTDFLIKKNIFGNLLKWRENLLKSNTLWQEAAYQDEAVKSLFTHFVEIDAALVSKMDEFHKDSVFSPEEIQKVT